MDIVKTQSSHTRVKLSQKHFSQHNDLIWLCAEQGYLFCFEKWFIPTIKTEYVPPMAKSRFIDLEEALKQMNMIEK